MKIRGSYIRELRKKNNLTQKELGRLSDVSESMICKIEAGERSPSLKHLKKIANNLSTTMDDLYG
ncbi:MULTISPECIES: helix-turn-helix domain-containing protein [Bacillus cereus group]|jgi:transcriptional regulator with XRE-family HTH domain|uniref:helix-turn-helix domain-containing protein n=1 Tax=Bacillus cereus group TaxID=86661 RepID=UPI0011A81A8A|nr:MULTISPECIES: helix-turn-helix transcriptional regulator [Bacillus cereus group]MDO8159145.1 helix-turn-helix transcriptional regulator [Bacillus toyonensis]